MAECRILEMLKASYRAEQHQRKQGGWGNPKPFDSFDNSVYGLAYNEIIRLKLKAGEEIPK